LQFGCNKLAVPGRSRFCLAGSRYPSGVPVAPRGRVSMSLSIGLLMVLTGLAIMAFGLFMFYAWLPLLYALIGLDIGLLLGPAFTGDVGTTAIVLGLASALILGAASYILEPYRRVFARRFRWHPVWPFCGRRFRARWLVWRFLRQSARVSLRRGGRFACARDSSTYLLSVHLPSVVQRW
jgi:hypothetical protein